jgi:hypothetical protein
MIMSTFQTVAKEFAAAFTTRTVIRNGTETQLYTLRDSAPGWCTDIVRDAHDGRMPDDWIYEVCYGLAGNFADCTESPEDGPHGYANACCNDYTGALTAWLASSLHNVKACEQAREEGLVAPDTSLADWIRAGQFHTTYLVAGAILAGLERQVERMSDVAEAAP